MNHRRGRIARPMRGVSALCGITLVVSLVLGTVALAPHVNAAPPSVNAAPEPASPTTGSSAPAVTANPVTPASLEFGPQQPFTSSPPQQLTFTNTTGSAINVQRTVEGGEGGLFTLSGCPFEPALLPGQSCVLTVVFQPNFAGPQTGTATIAFFSGNSILVRVPVTVHWLPIVFTPPTSLDLGSVPDGQTSSTVTVGLRNFWTVGTSVTSIHMTPGSGFTVTGSTCGALPSGATCTVGVSYSPGVHVGSATDNLIVTGPWGGPSQEACHCRPLGWPGPSCRSHRRA